MRWLWASYRLGAWREMMDAGLTQAAFSELITEIIGSADYDWMLDARGQEGNRPVGIVLGMKIGHVGRAIEPFVQWFPWATPRNQMEATAVFLREVSNRFKLVVFADEPDARFWEKFVRYGLARRGCKVLDYVSKGEHAMMFYTLGP